MTKDEGSRLAVECRNCGTLLRVPSSSQPKGDERIDVLCVKNGCERTYSYDIDDIFTPSDITNALVNMRDQGKTFADLATEERQQD